MRITADQAFHSATMRVALLKSDRERIARKSDRAGSALRIHELLQVHPFLTPQRARDDSRLTMPTVNSALAALERLGIVKEVTGRRRERVICYRALMDIFGEGAGAPEREA